MIFKIKTTSNKKLEEYYNKAMKELDDFFKINWEYNKPRIILVPDRKTIDSLRGKKTEPWIVGWASRTNVFLLNPKKFEKESNHKYSNEKFSALIKHEICHCFLDVVAKGYSQKPRWLIEGVCIYLSGQNKFKNKPSQLKEFLKYEENVGLSVYRESGFALEFLIKKYGKNKLIKLLKSLSKIKSKKEFATLFKKIYGFDLKYKNFES